MGFPSIRLHDVQFFRQDMCTRFPFRYGIASMTEVPHLFVVADVEVDGRMIRGFSADGLPPKWFTKHPTTTFEEDDLPAMLRVIRQAADTACEVGHQTTFFSWWRALYEAQHDWARQHQLAPLLAGLGVSLMERAALDALCRCLETPLHRVLRQNALGIELAALRPTLRGLTPADVLPETPIERIHLRHTVGLGDALRSEGEARPNDLLPYTLEENVHRYGLRFFKIKLSGDLAFDQARLARIAEILGDVSSPRVTLDGNESFSSISEFREAWDRLNASPAIRECLGRALLFVEQPIHRSRALEEEVGTQLRAWKSAPPMIIDESDADLFSLPRALALGYRGTSHKNCKGIVKAVLAAATIRQASEQDDDLILSAEDLGNVGPVALLQDLAVVAALGISHVERNGHHYFAGLSMFPPDVQRDVLAYHSDLYHDDLGFAALKIASGSLDLTSVNEAPFGLRPTLREALFPKWSF